MHRRAAVLLAALVLLLALPGGAAATLGVDGPIATPGTTTGAPANNTTSTQNHSSPSHAGFGAHLTGFMANSAAAADASVDQQFWESDFEHAANRTAVAESRARSLSKRYADLKERQRHLLAMRANGTAPGNSITARLRTVNASLAAIGDSIHHAELVTAAHNATPSDLDDLERTVHHDTPNRTHAWGWGHDHHGNKQKTGGGRSDHGPSQSNASRRSNASGGNGVGVNASHGGNRSSGNDHRSNASSDSGQGHGPGGTPEGANQSWRSDGANVSNQTTQSPSHGNGEAGQGSRAGGWKNGSNSGRDGRGGWGGDAGGSGPDDGNGRGGTSTGWWSDGQTPF